MCNTGVQREWDDWAHKPGLTHLSLVRSPVPSVVLCVHCQQLWDFTKLTHCQPVVFIYIFSMFFVLIHDYTLCFTGSPYCKFSYCKFSYYNYISICPYYIVIHYTLHMYYTVEIHVQNRCISYTHVLYYVEHVYYICICYTCNIPVFLYM